ncbi:hypothetical protein [Rhizobium sp. WYCCWR 11146]|uniref:hypothetical protein n=1 Tax=Rhizobium sp. WYCCWR 11146 TaxID=2749833 RepID=UPI0015E73F94|nr:hypothetical protein [Rhizobium sp. WYCCWR 11146]MBA1343897.1 hypothetical protein [Rhizobium sp. WYCCWR 11146]
MIEINPPMDHVEIAVSAVASKLETVILELRGLMQAEDIARCDAFNRAATVHEPDKADDAQGEKFIRIGQEYQLHRTAFQKLENVVQAAGIAYDAVQLARERYRSSLRKGELMKLLAVFDDEETKVKTKE